jgi:gluconate 5-dehydrogenase
MNVRDLFDLSGRVAIVTGGGKGIGLQMATGLAELGADLMLCARKPERCEAAADELSAACDVRAIGMRCDVADPAEVQAMVDRTLAELGRIDVLVNNAGTVWGATPEEFPLEAWQKVVNVNLTGTFLCSQAAGRVMLDSGSGSIVNIASVAGLHGADPDYVSSLPYHATKGGVIALTRDLAWKWGRRGIRVNAIAPGWFPSDMSQYTLGQHGDQFLRRIPLERFGGENDLKGAVALLASDAGAFITGATLVVDGGQSA